VEEEEEEEDISHTAILKKIGKKCLSTTQQQHPSTIQHSDKMARKKDRGQFTSQLPPSRQLPKDPTIWPYTA
jgi:hypothetical protein